MQNQVSDPCVIEEKLHPYSFITDVKWLIGRPYTWQISGCTWIAFYLAEWNQQAREGVLRNIATKQHFGSLMMLITTCRGYQLFLSDPESDKPNAPELSPGLTKGRVMYRRVEQFL